MPDRDSDPLDRLPKNFSPELIFQALNEHGVQYVVVGGMAAVLHGAEVSTVDLDVVVEQSHANRDRAIEALWALGAERVTNTQGLAGRGEPLPENGAGLVEPIESFSTGQGDIDLLREATVIGGYNDLSASAQVFFVEDQEVLVADLNTVIASKEASFDTKDQLHLRSLYDLREALEAEERAELLAETLGHSRAAVDGVDRGQDHEAEARRHQIEPSYEPEPEQHHRHDL